MNKKRIPYRYPIKDPHALFRQNKDIFERKKIWRHKIYDTRLHWFKKGRRPSNLISVLFLSWQAIDCAKGQCRKNQRFDRRLLPGFAQIDTFTNNSCGLVFNKVITFDIDIVKFNPLAGSSYIDLLLRLEAKQASLFLCGLGTHKNKDVF